MHWFWYSAAGCYALAALSVVVDRWVPDRFALVVTFALLAIFLVQEGVRAHRQTILRERR
jgi:hypothetical protein